MNWAEIAAIGVVASLAVHSLGAEPATQAAATRPATAPAEEPAKTLLASSTSVPQVRYLEAHAGGNAAWALAISPDGKTLASGGDDKKVLLWSLPELTLLKTIEVGGLDRCLAFSSDGKYLYAPGGSGYDVAEIVVADGSQRSLDVGAMGSIEFVSPFADDQKLVTVTASNMVLVHSLPEDHSGEVRLLARRKVFGGFIRHAVLSPDRRFLAVSSQNEVNNRSAAPRELTVFDLLDTAETSFTFQSAGDYNGSTLAFTADSETLLLYMARKPMQTFRLNKAEQTWITAQTDVHPPSSYAFASCTAEDGSMFVGSRDRIGMLPPGKNKFVLLATLSIRPGDGYPNDGIQGLVKIPGRSRLIAALQDGRLAAIDLVASTQPAAQPASSAASMPATMPSIGSVAKRTALYSASQRAKVTAAKTDMPLLSTALDMFYVDTGLYPTSEEGLEALIKQPAGVKNWKGPYLRKMVNDPWDRPYLYSRPGTHNPQGFDLCSLGPDGQEATVDNVTNWSPDATQPAAEAIPTTTVAPRR